MSPEQAWLLTGVGSLCAAIVVAVWTRDTRRALRDEVASLRAARETDAISVEAFRRDRDEALRQKAAQFEAWQSESTNLRADVAALERENEGLKRECRDATDLSIAFQREAEAAQRELALLRPIADSAEKLLDDEKLPGEWAPVRAAIRARKEAQP